MYSHPSVNFINILRVCFSFKILAPKTTKLAFGFEILATKISYEKRTRKTLMKLTTCQCNCLSILSLKCYYRSSNEWRNSKLFGCCWRWCSCCCCCLRRSSYLRIEIFICCWQICCRCWCCCCSWSSNLLVRCLQYNTSSVFKRRVRNKPSDDNRMIQHG